MKYRLQKIASHLGVIGGTISKAIYGHGIAWAIAGYALLLIVTIVPALLDIPNWLLTTYVVIVWTIPLCIVLPAIINQTTIKRMDTVHPERCTVTSEQIYNWRKQIENLLSNDNSHATKEEIKDFIKYARELIKSKINTIPGYENVDSSTYLGDVVCCYSKLSKVLLFNKSKAAGTHFHRLGISIIDCGTISKREVYSTIIHEFLHTFSFDEAFTTYGTIMISLGSNHKELIAFSIFNMAVFLHEWEIANMLRECKCIGHGMDNTYGNSLLYVPENLDITPDTIKLAEVDNPISVWDLAAVINVTE